MTLSKCAIVNNKIIKNSGGAKFLAASTHREREI